MSHSHRIGVCAWFLGLSACAPLTFSEKGNIDFDRYRTVSVQVTESGTTGPSAAYSDYFATELRASSGFKLVTTTHAASDDLWIDVEVNSTPSPGDDTRYDATAHYSATTPAGGGVTAGDKSDSGSTSEEATNDALQEVAVMFIAPFRL
jgi:hypothetical protein